MRLCISFVNSCVMLHELRFFVIHCAMSYDLFLCLWLRLCVCVSVRVCFKCVCLICDRLCDVVCTVLVCVFVGVAAKVFVCFCLCTL